MTEDKMNNDDLEEISRGIAEFNLGVDCACEQDRACRVCGLTEDIKDALKTLRFKTRKEDAEKYLTLEELKYLIFARADYLKVKDCDALAEIIYQRQLEKLSAQAILKKDEEESK